METLRKLLYFLKRKFFLYFAKQKPWKKNRYVSGNKPFLYFRYLSFWGQKVKKTHSWKVCIHKLKKLLIFQEGIDKVSKTNKKSALKKFLVSFDVVIFTAVKCREISCNYLYSAVKFPVTIFSSGKHREIPSNYLYSLAKHKDIPCNYLYSTVKHREIPCDYRNVL